MKLIICSRGVAGHILNNQDRYYITHVVSIGANDLRQRLPNGYDKHYAEKIRLEFDDINSKKRGKWHGATRKDIINLINFFNDALKTENPSFLIHCYAGISRSTAAGMILLYMFYNDMEQAKQELYKLVPRASPNNRMLKIAKEVLNGRRNKENS